ncbi:hypothetical protein [Selenomonas sp. AE3005]|uniref:hypothetical protein n=1 Tax=Selenomonas sp. AE3005 TaxID=1485543 RepID=UPI0004895914|nr:hypothetical protein [Selenomonas sp. AE3005]
MIDISVFKQLNEYDAYLRPVFTGLGHCHCKGGGESTTVQKRDIPAQTKEEKALQDKLQKYSESGLAGATKLQQEALDYLKNVKGYDWDDLYKKYNGDIDKALADFKKSGDKNLASYARAVEKERSEYLSEANKNYANQKAESDRNTSDYAAAQEGARSRYENDSSRNTADYTGRTNAEASKYENALNNARASYESGLNGARADADKREEGNAATYAYSQQNNTDRNYDELTKARNAYADAQRGTLSDYTDRRDGADKQHQYDLESANRHYKDRQELENQHYNDQSQNDIYSHSSNQSNINNRYERQQGTNIQRNQNKRADNDLDYRNEREDLIDKRDRANDSNNRTWELQSSDNNFNSTTNRLHNEIRYGQESGQNLQDKNDKLAKSERDYINNQGSNIDRYRQEQEEHLNQHQGRQDEELYNYKNDKLEAAKELYNRQQDNISVRSDADSAENAKNTANNDSYLSNWNNRSQQLNDRHRSELEGSTNDYTSKLDDIGSRYRSKLDDIESRYTNAQYGNADKWEELSNGRLAGDWAKNRRQALKDDLDATQGSWLSNMARRGIINSSTANTGLDSVNQSVSDTLAKSFSNDMAQQAGILRDQQAQDKDRYTSLWNLYNADRTDEENRAKAAYDARNVLSNTSYNDALKQVSDYYNQQVSNEAKRHQDVLNYNQNVYNERTDADKAYNAGLNDTYDKTHQTATAQEANNYAARQQADTNNFNAATTFNQNLYNNRNQQAQQGFADAQGITDTLNKQRQADEAARYAQQKDYIDNSYAHQQARNDAYNNAMIETADKYWDNRAKAEADRFAAQSSLNSDVYNHSTNLEGDVYKAQLGLDNQLHNDRRADNTAYYNNDKAAADSAQKSALDTASALYGARSKMDDANNQARVNAETQRYNAQEKANTQAYNAFNDYNKAKDARDLAALKDIYASTTNNADNIYKVNSTAADNIYKTNQSLYDNVYKAANTDNNNIYSARQKATDNYYNGINTANQHNFDTGIAAQGTYFNGAQQQAQNVFTATTGAADKHFQGAGTAQANQFYAPGRMLDFAQNLYLPSQNQFNTMYSGRMGAAGATTTTSQSSDNSGMWGAVGTLGSAFVACFTAGTKVTTPTGYKNIEDIKAGDEVLSLNEQGDIVTKKVTYVNPPHKQRIVNACFKNGTVWHTTESQRYYDGRHFSYIDYPGEALVFHGRPSEIAALELTDKIAYVYDFAVDGVNVFFANDVAAEGFGE